LQNRLFNLFWIDYSEVCDLFAFNVPSLFVPWSSRSRGGSASIHRTQVVAVRRRAENKAMPPTNGLQTAESLKEFLMSRKT
jgi:hypothetical protein